MARQIRISFSLSLISTLLFLVASCATNSVVEPPFDQFSSGRPLIGFYHKVGSSDTLSGLAKEFNITADIIKKANKLSDSGFIEPGQLLYIPLQKRSAMLDRAGMYEKTNSFGGQALTHFMWPLRGDVITRFGVKKDDIVSKGIDIAAESGSFVRAARDGTVSFSEEELSGLGKLIVIDHGSGFQTVYAHNSKNLVKVGESVKQNDIIAHVGSSGYALKPFLHFEIRKDHRAVDPIEYLR